MSNFNYGNSFNSYEGENVGVQRISVWKSVREFFPGGAVLTPSDYSSFKGAWSNLGLKGEVGEIVPAGTPIQVTKPGGKALFGSPASAIGLTYEDVQLGTDGCTFTIVTQGEFLESRKEGPALAEGAKEQLFGRISFIKEVD